ncbi:TPA: NYN domain-containing protein [Neisseria meningitidis]
MLHLKDKINGTDQMDDLYRIFFYDCVPFEKKMHNPVSHRAIDFSKTPEAIFRCNLHTELKKKRKLALRLGKLSDNTAWILKPQVMKNLLKNPSTQITENDVVLDVKQKGVDMRIGLDISSITLKNKPIKSSCFLVIPILSQQPN